MAREIRVTVDDDEVFERMKARKRDLDLSWEEVLHRGLRRDDPAGTPDRQRGRDDLREGGDRRDRSGAVRRNRGRDEAVPRDPVSDPEAFAAGLKRQIQGQVLESLESTLGPEERAGPDREPLETEVSSLEAAEDAVLRFDFLDDAAADPANQVPLRVTMEASTDGLDIDVVAIRQGKAVRDTNAFDPAIRKRVAERLAAGDAATLAFEAGDERYGVAPVLSWSRTDGTPTVTDVAIETVSFDGD